MSKTTRTRYASVAKSEAGSGWTCQAPKTHHSQVRLGSRLAPLGAFEQEDFHLGKRLTLLLISDRHDFS
jgi:hypothetical protein